MRGRLVGVALSALAVLGGVGLGGSPALAVGPDSTPPVVDSVVSADFPPLDSPAPATGRAGQPGAFTITAHDDGGGLRRVEWLVTGERSVGGTTDNSRFAGWRALDYAPSATVTVVVTPPEWGTNVLRVWATDRGGRVTQTFQYVFYAPGDTAPSLDGDIDGDRVPDVVTTDGRGDLRVYPGAAGGGLETPYVASSASNAPDGSGWAGLLAHRGASLGRADDLWALSPGGVLSVYRNDGIGDFTSDRAINVARPSCSCPGRADDWSGVTSMALVADGGVDGTTTFVTIESGQAWQSPVTFGTNLGTPVRAPLRLRDATRSDLIAPGDVDGDGRAELWVRDRVTGALTQFGGTDTGFASEGTVLAWSGFDAARHPVVTSVGDLSGDGVADLLTTSPLGGLQIRSAASLRSASWVAPAPFVAKAVTVEGQRAHP